MYDEVHSMIIEYRICLSTTSKISVSAPAMISKCHDDIDVRNAITLSFVDRENFFPHIPNPIPEMLREIQKTVSPL